MYPTVLRYSNRSCQAASCRRCFRVRVPGLLTAWGMASIDPLHIPLSPDWLEHLLSTALRSESPRNSTFAVRAHSARSMPLQYFVVGQVESPEASAEQPHLHARFRVIQLRSSPSHLLSPCAAFDSVPLILSLQVLEPFSASSLLPRSSPLGLHGCYKKLTVKLTCPSRAKHNVGR